MTAKSKSETSKVRDKILPWLHGSGLDLGFGGDKIKPSAIAVDLEVPYTTVGSDLLNLSGDASDLYWFRDGVFDYVYSSHLIEDFEDTGRVLFEWSRVLRRQGRLVLVFPEEQKFREHCYATGQRLNAAHKHENFGPERIRDSMPEGMVLIAETFLAPYSWLHVWEKKGDF